ncbi:hypothetical protein DEO72_LG2g3696 [Vigna unguiculata]|uniref:Uncharacterized protein n=1 Tax=Vigna unguiculata TaxID=3917 RepID=A0A4D6L499_VIGUN|nr:hypothetical protein DEO72_LG2g3696 [Vigna unguiculata]
MAKAEIETFAEFSLEQTKHSFPSCEKPVILAQESSFRLSENSRNSPLPLFKLLLRPRALVLSEEQSHSNEKVSFKREFTESHNTHCSSSRLGKNA